MQAHEYTSYEIDKATNNNEARAVAYARCTGTLASIVDYVSYIAGDDTMSAQERIQHIKLACDIEREGVE